MLIRYHHWNISGVLSCCGAERGRLLLRAGVGVAAVVLVVGCFSLYTPVYSEYLMRSLKGTIPPDDPELLEYIRNEMLIPPSDAPYNLEGKYNAALIAVEDSEYYYANMTKLIFKGMRNGVFIEAGALDGESMSNTLRLEKHFGWSGLLVEGDAVSFSKLKKKNRKAWITDSCLSPHSYPSMELMSSNSHYVGPSILKAGNKIRAMHSLVSYRKGEGLTNSWYKKVQCVPLQSLMLAINMRHVDLFVLDVEGAEMDIIKHMDFKQFEIDVIYLEWKKVKEHTEIAKRVEDRGYRLFSKLAEDLVFVRKSSRYDPGFSYVIPPRNLTFSPEAKKAFEEMKKKGIYVEGA